MRKEELGAWSQYIDFTASGWDALSEGVEQVYSSSEVFPPRDKLFAALQLTPPQRVKVIILGQDPYHEPGQAHGLSFSVEPGVPTPKSLVNIYKELAEDLSLPVPETGCLAAWAEQGVLLLNSVLTVEAHLAGSHRKLGWERFTDQIISATNQLPQPVVLILWGAYAAKKAQLVSTAAPRLILKSAHPSPLSAYRGFFGSRPFSAANRFLEEHGSDPVDWRITG